MTEVAWVLVSHMLCVLGAVRGSLGGIAPPSSLERQHAGKPRCKLNPLATFFAFWCFVFFPLHPFFENWCSGIKTRQEAFAKKGNCRNPDGARFICCLRMLTTFMKRPFGYERLQRYGVCQISAVLLIWIYLNPVAPPTADRGQMQLPWFATFGEPRASNIREGRFPGLFWL